MLPLGKRIALKIERIIREEMDAIEGQVTMPVVMPANIGKVVAMMQWIIRWLI